VLPSSEAVAFLAPAELRRLGTAGAETADVGTAAE